MEEEQYLYCSSIFLLGIEQYKIQGINLIFFIPTSLVAIWLNSKNKLIEWNIVKICVISGIVGSMIGAFLAGKIESESLKRYFGIFLLIIAINGIYTFISQYIKKNKWKK